VGHDRVAYIAGPTLLSDQLYRQFLLRKRITSSYVASLETFLKHFVRSAELPCVNESGFTLRPAMR
jgi:hypothetical protein